MRMVHQLVTHCLVSALLTVAACSNGGGNKADAAPDIVADLQRQDEVDRSDAHDDLKRAELPGDASMDLPADNRDTADGGKDTELQDSSEPDDLEMDAPDFFDDVDAAELPCGDCPPSEKCVEGSCVAILSHIWSQTLGGDEYDRGMAIAATTGGGAVVGGHAGSTYMALDGDKIIPVMGGNPTSIYAVRFDGDGEVLFARTFDGGGDDRLRGIGADHSGGTVLGGLHWSPLLHFDDKSLAAAGKMDGYVTRLTPTGQVDWAVPISGPLDDGILTVAADLNNNILVGGYFASPTVDVAGALAVNTTGTEQLDSLVASIKPDGTANWAMGLGSSAFDYVHGITVDDQGYVYATGGFNGGGFVLAGTELDSAGESDVWVARFSPQGDALWLQGYGGPSHDASHAIAPAADGGVVIVGSFQSEVIDFGGSKLQHAGPPDFHDVFVLKLTAEGEHVWSHGWGGPDWDLGKSIAADASGNIYVAGAYNGPYLDFGGGPLPPAGAPGVGVEAFLLMLSANGEHAWSASFGGPDNDYGYAVAATPAGAVFVTGFFNGSDSGILSGTIDFGGGPMHVEGGSDAYLVRFQ